MGLREQLQKVTQVFQRARSKGRQLREDDAGGAGDASSAAAQSSQREARRRGGMTAEDRDWEQASQQRNRDRQAQSGEPTISADESTLFGDT
jgi:hypothetical protein